MLGNLIFSYIVTISQPDKEERHPLFTTMSFFYSPCLIVIEAFWGRTPSTSVPNKHAGRPESFTGIGHFASTTNSLKGRQHQQ